MPSLIIMDIWKYVGYDMVIYLAGLQGIPKHLYEAVEVDGGGRWPRFKYVTWPLLAPTTFFILVISIINRFKIFATVHTMTGGGPAGATEAIVFYVTLIQWGIGKRVHYQ